MVLPASAPASAVETGESTVRDKLAEQLWRGLLVFGIVGVPTSLVRVAILGWQPVIVIQAIGALSLFVIALFRRRMSTRLKSILAAALPMIFAIPALSTFGFYSGGLVWITASCVTTTMFFSTRVTYIVIGLQIVLLAAFAYAFTNGMLALQFDANEFIRKPQAWIAVIAVAGIVSGALTYGFNVYYTAHQSMLQTIREQHSLIVHQAAHDGLTGLPLPHLARDRLNQVILQAQRDHCRAALLFIDLDAFKTINDTFGHDAGDFVLTTVAKRLLETIRAVDSASRQGGDEFMVVLGGISAIDDAIAVANKLVKSIAHPMDYRGQTLQVGASIGIAVYPDHADASETMMKLADSAMYKIKKAGKNGYMVASVNSI